MTGAEQLRQVVRDVRRQWRWKLMLRGLSVFLPATVLCIIVATLGMDRLRFQPSAVLAFSLAVYAAVAIFCLWFLARPLRRRVTDEQVSLYVEEHEPGLAGELVTAVEFAEQQGAQVSPDLVRRLVEGAVARASGLDAKKVERSSVMRSSGVLAGTSVAMLAMALINPSFLRNGLSYLLAPLARSVKANPYSIDVTPGDTLVARGADVRINASLRNFGAERVEVVLRHSADGAWERWSMAPDPASGQQTLLLFKVQQASEYYVEATGVRSRTFHVAVADLPYTKEIDLEYHYPAYTGLPIERQENTGDIAAMAGTNVTVEVTPTVRVDAGVLVLSGTDTVRLTADGVGKLTGVVKIEKPGAYRVALRANNGTMVSGSADYTIDVLADRKPIVRFTKPGRDTRATSIDEVFTEATAQDDYGVQQLEFVYSVNGGPQKVERLYVAGASALKRVTAGHTFYLEELSLKPGDFISYFARAADARGAPGTAASDIYFLEIRPFDRSFKQGDQQEGQGGQNPGEQVGELSGRERDIVAGTFRMVRDSASYSDKDYRENLATLALGQGRLRDDVKQLADRMKSRGVVQLDSTLAAVLEALPPAVEAMSQAEEQLGQRKAPTAMPPEQQALQYLQRAEEAFREREVTRGQRGGGAGQRASTDELSELFDLELDRQRNQYEQVQRGEQQQADQKVDETLERLRALAQRQQAENERMRAQGAQQGNPQAGGGAGGQGQRALADSVADLARQLEKLSREQQNDQLAESARQLRQAADQMRRAAADGASGSAQGNAALDRLAEARRLLEQNRSGSLKRDVQDALNRAERLAQQEQGITNDVNRIAADSNPADSAHRARVSRLSDQKADMANQVKDLVNDLDRMARESRQDQPDAAGKLRDAAQGARTTRLEDMINYSRGVIQGRSPQYAQAFEQQIGGGVGALRDHVKDALGAIGENRDQRVQRNLDKARDVTNGFESLAERMEQQRQPAGQSASQPDAQGRPGGQGAGAQERQGQNGQPGRQAGQAGQGQQEQQGQSGQQGQNGQQGQGGQQGEGSQGGGQRRLADNNRQLQNDLRQQTQQLRDLRDQMRQDGVDVGDLNRMLDGLGRMDSHGATGNPRDIAQLKQTVVQGLKDWEFNLRRQLAGGNPALYGAGSEDVSPEYRKMVEQYYKSLAQQKK